MICPRHSGSPTSPCLPEEGFVLPTVLGVGLILLVSALALSYSAFQANLGGIQRFQATEAEAHAESGIAQVFNALNNQYFYLAGTSDGQWTSTYNSLKTLFTQAIASNSNLAGCLNFLQDPTTSGSPLGQRSYGAANWKLESYIVSTSNATLYGTITTSGRSTTGAETTVRRTYQLGTQTPGGPFGSPGLLSGKIDLGNNDILGTSAGSCAGNILCANCNSAADVNRQPQSVVDGTITFGSFSWPSPTRITNPINLGEIKNSITLPRSGDTPINGAYIYSVTNIETNGTITINPYTYGTTPTPDCTPAINKPSACHPVIFYLSGSMKLNGQAQIANTGGPEDFIIFGNNLGGSKQDITLNGGSSASMFVYAPTAEVGIDGGSSSCKSDTKDQNSCTIKGAIWSGIWGRSSSNPAAIRVPSDLASRIGNSSALSFLAGSLPQTSLLPSNIQKFYLLQKPSTWQRGS